MTMISRYARVQDGRMSHAEELARTLPPTVSLVKAFNSLEVSERSKQSSFNAYSEGE